MDASHDRRDYPNIDARSLWLAQVSEAATALAGTRVPDQFSGSTPNASFEPALEAKIKPISVGRDDLFNANVPVSPYVRSNLRFAKVGGLLMISALTASVLASQPMITDIWQQLVTDSVGIVKAGSPTARGAISIGPAKPRLIVQQSRATSGEPVPLGLTIGGPVDGAVVHIEGLVRGMELSAGRAVGLDRWEVSADGLGDVWIAPPDGFAGLVHLIAELRGPDGKVADRQTTTLEWASTTAPVPAQQLTESTALASISPTSVQPRDDENYRTDAILSELRTSPQSALTVEEPRVPPRSPATIQLQPDREEVAPPKIRPLIPLEARWKEPDTASSTILEPIQLRSDRTEMMAAEVSKSPSQSQPNSEELAVLLKRGKELIATGDLAAARLVLQRAAEANNAEAALALGATYDPLVLRQLKVYGFAPDAAMARSWYEKAAELGSSAAPRRLELLTERTGTR
jgi:hypothetical protein